MPFTSINPATGATLSVVAPWNDRELEAALQQAAKAAPAWAGSSLAERGTLLCRLADELRRRKEELACLITQEMGKLIKEARAEIDKCADGCDYYAEHGAAFLIDEIIPSDAGQSYIAYQPLGTVLAVMPWNFPFWQVFRAAAPTLMAGNTLLLKHASNVSQCALAIEQLFNNAGFPPGVFRALMIETAKVSKVIEDARVHAVTVTGSVEAGRQISACAAANLKKSVLELGGSDAFIVLEDTDMEHTVKNAVASRFMNAGQSCIAAKRFIVVETIAAEFMERFKTAVEKLAPGDPLLPTTTLAPLARFDLRDGLHQQVTDSIGQGAVPVTGCAPLDGPGAFYAPSILDQVKPGMLAYSEELFGPVASVMRARDEEEALAIANDTSFGLGGSVWTRDTGRGERLARRLRCGVSFVNGTVKSDPRLPFGGIKNSGYGRELSHHGIREFVNIKTVWLRGAEKAS